MEGLGKVINTKIGVDRYAPETGSIEDMAKLTMNYKYVSTIDTALAPVCSNGERILCITPQIP